MTGDLRLNFSGQEASSEARGYEVKPTGWYPCYLIDGEVRLVGEGKNEGKEYWSLQLQTDPEHPKYPNARFFANVMLFEGALYNLAQLLKAFGYDVDEGEVDIPDLGELVGNGEIIDVSVLKVRDDYKMKRAQAEGEQLDGVIYKNEVKGFRPHKQRSATTASAGSNLLP